MVKVKVKILILIIGIIMIGCYPEFTNPVSDPIESKLDDRLLGTWCNKSKKEKLCLHIEKGSNNLANIIVIGGNRKGMQIDESLVFTMFSSKLENDFYMNLQDQELKNNSKYIIVKYLINNKDELLIWDFSNDQLSKDIQQGKLVGKVAGKRFSSAQVTDSSLGLAHYLSSSDHKHIFSFFDTFEKITKIETK